MPQPGGILDAEYRGWHSVAAAAVVNAGWPDPLSSANTAIDDLTLDIRALFEEMELEGGTVEAEKLSTDELVTLANATELFESRLKRLSPAQRTTQLAEILKGWIDRECGDFILRKFTKRRPAAYWVERVRGEAVPRRSHSLIENAHDPKVVHMAA
jgi:hypothetical protein